MTEELLGTVPIRHIDLFFEMFTLLIISGLTYLFSYKANFHRQRYIRSVAILLLTTSLLGMGYSVAKIKKDGGNYEQILMSLTGYYGDTHEDVEEDIETEDRGDKKEEETGKENSNREKEEGKENKTPHQTAQNRPGSVLKDSEGYDSGEGNNSHTGDNIYDRDTNTTTKEVTIIRKKVKTGDGREKKETREKEKEVGEKETELEKDPNTNKEEVTGNGSSSNQEQITPNNPDKEVNRPRPQKPEDVDKEESEEKPSTKPKPNPKPNPQPNPPITEDGKDKDVDKQEDEKNEETKTELEKNIVNLLTGVLDESETIIREEGKSDIEKGVELREVREVLVTGMREYKISKLPADKRIKYGDITSKLLMFLDKPTILDTPMTSLDEIAKIRSEI